MVEMIPGGLAFSFPEVHPEAKLLVRFQRTLRIPDTGELYPLPPGLGPFALQHVDDFASRVPPRWLAHGGVMLPMYQSEALWIEFNSVAVPGHEVQYPFAVKVAAGKIDAITGQRWSNDLGRHPQDYVVVPEQPWLDGFCVEKGVIRQFVAMPLGAGYTAEEQLTGEAEHGGLQLLVRPMRRDVFDRRFPARSSGRSGRIGQWVALGSRSVVFEDSNVDLGLAPGGRMRQEVVKDPFGLHEWETAHQSRAFVHLANSLIWEAITGAQPPSPPPTARVYSELGLPWYDYYEENREALDGADALHRLRSVIEMARAKGEPALPENRAAVPEQIVKIGGTRRRGVRDGGF